MAWDLYLRDVLGVRQVVWPVSETPVIAASEPVDAAPDVDLAATKILFLGEPRGSAALSEFDLFLRMRAAMKLQPNESAIWEITPADLALKETAIPNEIIVVSFSKKLGDYLRTQRPKLEIVATASPFDVEKDPRLKRQVWEDLKRALEKAGLSSRLQA